MKSCGNTSVEAARAAQRLKHVSIVAAERYQNVEPTPNLDTFLDVVANALKFRDGTEPSVDALRAHVPLMDLGRATSEVLAAAVERAKVSNVLFSNRTAGAKIGLLSDEVRKLYEHDIAVPLWPVDEDDDERNARRDERAREKASARQARYIASRKTNVANRADGGDTPSVSGGCNIRQPDAVLAALRGGAETPPAIAERSGLNIKVVRPLLSRLKAAGKITSPRRGVYKIAAPVEAVAPMKAAEPSPQVAPQLRQPHAEHLAAISRKLVADIRAAFTPLRACRERHGALAPAVPHNPYAKVAESISRWIAAVA